ncbi:hypothetical protein PN441_06765 [Spirulina major CS-329]|uniref:hypothetical protein n=1 Tax=Spirulina TaxID=1154 RepID=UPI00232E6F62|nr:MULTISPECIES: hypothetical protein [Spirulina]MDB9496333.1 hypothetical protein [Spirulina subsalsa CS-330]MDB9502769.1 hypothetical protein [Spirulina major CS-329]
MTAPEVSKQSDSLLSWLAITGIKCDMAKGKAFLSLAANLVLLDTVEIIPTWRRLLKLGWRIVSTILWGILILIILSSLGRYFAFGSVPSSVSNPVGVSDSSTVAIQADKLTLEIDNALVAAREAALTTASDELDQWVDSLMNRVDSSQDGDFLDWYFGYWTQQKFGLDGTLQAGKRVFNKNLPTAKEKIQEEVLQEFTNRVLRPEIARLELKTISRDISQIYTSELQRNLEKIRIKYNIPKANWNEYLENVTVLVTNIEGRQVPLQLKAFTIASLGGGALLAKAAIVAIEKVTAKVATKVVAKASASFLGKAGALVGGELLGPVVTVAIIVWDAVDIHNTEVNYRPILKQNIEDYFNLMKRDILGDEENGIQKVILDIENSIRKGMSGSRLPFLSRG